MPKRAGELAGALVCLAEGLGGQPRGSLQYTGGGRLRVPGLPGVWLRASSQTPAHIASGQRGQCMWGTKGGEWRQAPEAAAESQSPLYPLVLLQGSPY